MPESTSNRTVEAVKLSAIFLAVIIAITQLWDWFAAPSESLEGDITYGSFELPPGLVNQIEELQQLAQEDTLKQQLKLLEAFSFIEDSSVRTVAEERALSRISRFLRISLPYTIPEPYSRLSGYWAAELRNTGSTTLQDVSLTLPGTVYATVSREGEPRESGAFGPVFRFKTLQPQETIDIYAWATIAPSRYHDDDVKLVHSSGFGSVSFRAPVAPFWVFMDDYWPVFAFPLGFFVAMVVIVGFSLFAAYKKAPSPEMKDELDRDSV